MLETTVDTVFSTVKDEGSISVFDLADQLDTPRHVIAKIGQYLQDAGLVDLSYVNVKGPTLEYISDPPTGFEHAETEDIIEKLKFYNNVNNLTAANNLVRGLFEYYRRVQDDETKAMYQDVRAYYEEHFMQETDEAPEAVDHLDEYSFDAETLTLNVDIVQQPLEPVPFYILSRLETSDVTARVIDEIKDDVVSEITTNIKEKTKEETVEIKEEYEEHVLDIINDVFIDLDPSQREAFANYVITTSLGMGEIEFLLDDPHLEEIVVNNADEPVRIYHREHGWMNTNILPKDEEDIIHYATIAGREVEKTITTLHPLMDAHLESGDRVNASLTPISTKGNTITIRKFADQPWTITDFIKNGTIDADTAALIWSAIEHELSVLIVGGTGTGKTSALNVFSFFIPPDQRIVSIEDTREIRLPSTLHWVPMETRDANPEGKGEVSMLDLVVNSLRMRPDRIIVGEIRRKRQAEVLFEAIHTGHSVYSTLHANTVKEAVIRLTTDPINISDTLLGALDLMVVQNRNRRTNERHTFQIAEMETEGDYNLLYNYDFNEEKLTRANRPQELYDRLQVFSGMSRTEVEDDIEEKADILVKLVEEDITSLEEIGRIFSHYYTDKDYLMSTLFDGGT